MNSELREQLQTSLGAAYSLQRARIRLDRPMRQRALGDIAVAEQKFTDAIREYRGADTGTYKRLGELNEAKGDREKAASYFGRFIDVWKDADPELQPKVADAKRRLAALSRESGIGNRE